VGDEVNRLRVGRVLADEVRDQVSATGRSPSWSWLTFMCVIDVTRPLLSSEMLYAGAWLRTNRTLSKAIPRAPHTGK
jgi:hypothetical protein